MIHIFIIVYMVEVYTTGKKSHRRKNGELFYDAEKNLYVFNYTEKFSPISLNMPFKPSSYVWQRKLHPIFDMVMPEGYLLELLKNYLSKRMGNMNDYILFSFLCPNIHGHLNYRSDFAETELPYLEMDTVLEEDTEDTFRNLVQTFLGKNAISGVQPKTLAILREKDSLVLKEYIVKTWGSEFPQLAFNEYVSLQAVALAGVPTARCQLSRNNRFLLVERFNYDKENNTFLGFEEVLVLLGKNREEKYNGSYEQITRVIYNVVTDKDKTMITLFKMIVMNYLLRNGDAHLKNFGILYDNPLGSGNPEGLSIWLAPAYDVVNTVAYVFKDVPALTMFGQKVWHGKKSLLRFGKAHCQLTNSQVDKSFLECIQALDQIIRKTDGWIRDNPDFSIIGNRMMRIWKHSLENHATTFKELPREII